MRMQNPLPLNNINTFASAAEYLSFQQAADALFVTPSAVSHQIRNLEQILGYKLFERLDKRVKLTPQGELLFNDIRAPVKQLLQASRKALRGAEDNSLALSVAPLFAIGWLFSRLKDFQTSHPEINLTVIATSDLINFNSDPFDASIRMGYGDWQELYMHKLFNCEMVAACHPSLLDSRGKLFLPEEVNKYQLVNNTTLPNIWNEWFQSAGVESSVYRDYSVQVQSSAQVIETLQSGEFIGFVDHNFIEDDIQSGRLAIACDHILKGDAAYFLTAPKNTDSLPAFKVFKEWMDVQLENND